MYPLYLHWIFTRSPEVCAWDACPHLEDNGVISDMVSYRMKASYIGQYEKFLVFLICMVNQFLLRLQCRVPL